MIVKAHSIVTGRKISFEWPEPPQDNVDRLLARFEARAEAIRNKEQSCSR